MDRIDLGRRGEDAAVRHLEARGWRILDRNVRSRGGEVDVVAGRDDVVAFVEVKTRRSRAFGMPAEAVTFRKMARIRSVALEWLAARRPAVGTVRFDVIEVEVRGARARIRHIEDAFA